VNSTKFKVTFATPATHAAASLTRFYPNGGMNLGASGGTTAIGRGLPGSTNAVTDTLSTITPPTRWDSGNQRGSSGTRSAAGGDNISNAGEQHAVGLQQSGPAQPITRATRCQVSGIFAL
jgi:hypothetical protein